MTESTTLPHVTVVIPTHARPVLLAKLLDSLIEQTYPASHLEVIVVHNKSDDNTESIVNERAQTAPFPLRYIQTNFQGPHPSRRLGAREATGGIVAFTDDDCVVTPEWIAYGVACFTPDTGLAQGRTLPNPDHPRHPLERTIQITEETPFYETCNIFYRKEALMEPGVFCDDLFFCGEDTDLAWNVKERGYTSTFCQDAVVYHEVFSVNFFQWLMAPAQISVVPELVRRHPILREHMFLGYFLHVRTTLFDLFLLGVFLGVTLHPLSLLLALPYLIYRYREPIHIKNPLFRVARVLFGIPRACVLFAALAIGTLRSRSLLL